nr:hypothetical protein [uncultured Sphingomonas sp.]
MIADETRLNVSQAITAVINALSDMGSQPNEPSHQVRLQESMLALRGITEFSVNRDPVFAAYAAEIGGAYFFGPELIKSIDRIIKDGAMTPAAARLQIQDILAARYEYINDLNQLISAMGRVNISPERLEPGEAQVGFRVPRALFDNELDGWVNELRVIQRIMRAFSELAVGKPEDLKIGEISTTDPIIFLEAAAPTVALVGMAVSWSLDQWKKIEEIRNLREQTRRLSEQNGGSLDELVANFDDRIKSAIDRSIEQHAEALVQPGKAAGRGHEQVNNIAYALRALTARIERGMTVEIRFLPPAQAAEEEVQQAFADIEKVVPTLAFPPAAGEPVILLPKHED